PLMETVKKKIGSLLLRFGRRLFLVAFLVSTGVSATWLALRVTTKPESASGSGPSDSAEKGERFRRADRDTPVRSWELVRAVGVPTSQATDPKRIQTLPPFQGTLALDSNRFSRVLSRFAGEVVALGTVDGHLQWVSGFTYPSSSARQLRAGDPVRK